MVCGDVSVRQILGRPELAGAKVLGGGDSLDRPVSAVTVAEIPDISRWLSGADFVHGVGRMFVEPDGTLNEDSLLAWVVSLIDANAACLALKTGRYINTVPQSVIDLGNEAGFPIIELPEGAIQADITAVVFRMILEASQEREQKRTKLFTDMVRDLFGPHLLSHDAERIAAYLHHPVVIVDHERNVLGASIEDDDGPSLDEARVAIERTLASGEQISSLAVSDNQYLVRGQIDGGQLVVAGVDYAREHLGYVAMMGEELTPDEIYFFASLAEVVTVDMSQNVMVENSAMSARREFFAEIAKPEIDLRLASHLASLIGLTTTEQMRAAVIAIDGTGRESGTDVVGDRRLIKKAASYTAQYLRGVLDPSEKFIVCEWERGAGIVFTGERHAPERYRAIVQGIVRGLGSVLRITEARAGIGDASVGIEGIHESAQHAFYAVTCIETFRIPQKVVEYKDLSSYVFLDTALASSANSRTYVEFVLGPLLHQDSDYASELLDTLSAYLDSNASYAGAAKSLHLHVNTVRYRIEKISDLLRVDLASADGRGAIWLAMRLYRILTTQGSWEPDSR